MQKVININTETGEKTKVQNLYYDDKESTFKQVEYEKFDYILSETNGKVELLYFPEQYRVPKHLAVDETYVNSKYTLYELEAVLNQNKFILVDGIAVPKNKSITVMDLQETFRKSSKRAIKCFYNYALANEWEYFCTFTFADSKIRNDKDLLYDTWKKFLYMLRKQNTEVKAIAVYEEFEKGGYHIHALLANCDIQLIPGRDNKTGKFVYSKFGNQVFNSLQWKHGFTNIVTINPDSIQVQVVNYLSKYMTKNSPTPYRCKRYFHTTNLNERDTYCGQFDKQLIPEIDTDLIKMIEARNNIGSKKFSLPQAILCFDLHEVETKKKNIKIYRNY